MYNNRLNAELEMTEEMNKILLPDPATFIIDQEGTVIYKYCLMKLTYESNLFFIHRNICYFRYNHTELSKK